MQACALNWICWTGNNVNAERTAHPLPATRSKLSRAGTVTCPCKQDIARPWFPWHPRRHPRSPDGSSAASSFHVGQIWAEHSSSP